MMTIKTKFQNPFFADEEKMFKVASDTKRRWAVLNKDGLKVLGQFIHNALDGKDIVLKSEGKQHFSYLHVADAVSGILTVMLEGKCGEAYNVADEKSDITLRDLAALIAKQCGRKVIFDLPTASESVGFSPAMLARLDNERLISLGWSAQYAIVDGIAETIGKMKEMRNA